MHSIEQSQFAHSQKALSDIACRTMGRGGCGLMKRAVLTKSTRFQLDRPSFLTGAWRGHREETY